MSQHRSPEHGAEEEERWGPRPAPARPGDSRVRRPGDGPARLVKRSGPARPVSANHSAPRQHARASLSRPLTGSMPLTAFGVSFVLLGTCLAGAALDLLLVGTAAWCLIGLFLAGSAYAALHVRRSDWYSAVVGPPLAFACGLLLIATFSPHDLATGLTGTIATMLELLAYKARTVFLGTALALFITLMRRLPVRK
ncbi:hypothetical protein KGA66_05205 [Actinocrinis puniceicyclus]|uniref:DUF6542 domain-containing protein n=1 Tax=Actinocrinis puniceicyclus TaxID=977794 RepID=A0A8J7WMI7_9ACTN|nr:DUF6542 domain-containing protein [Actinocrinis puniceicyclus]MBS2962432.1 hypothetical protein [Actinocrinis puniceicyclus]